VHHAFLSTSAGPHMCESLHAYLDAPSVQHPAKNANNPNEPHAATFSSHHSWWSPPRTQRVEPCGPNEYSVDDRSPVRPHVLPARTHVWPRAAKMRNPVVQDQLEMTLVEWNKEVKAFARNVPRNVRTMNSPLALSPAFATPARPWRLPPCPAP